MSRLHSPAVVLAVPRKCSKTVSVGTIVGGAEGPICRRRVTGQRSTRYNG
jgi:hypothetical protein